MSHLAGSRTILAARLARLATLTVVIIGLASCHKPESVTENAVPVQKTFASPADAGAAFLEAAKSGDQSALLAIFGPESKDVLFSGDAVKDKNALQDFVAAYTQMNRWGKIKVGGEILYTGADNYPFPIPLQQNSSGQWYFNTAAGKDEILARRIGKGELTAIAACHAIADAEQLYFSKVRDGATVKHYAQKFISDEGKQDGLYWPVAAGQPPSPFGGCARFCQSRRLRQCGRQAATVQWLLFPDIDQTRG